MYIDRNLSWLPIWDHIACFLEEDALIISVIEEILIWNSKKILSIYFVYMYLIAQTTFLIQACISVGVEIGQLPNEQHGVSGTLYVTDARTLSFEGFNYDGLGPGSYVIQCMIPIV